MHDSPQRWGSDCESWQTAEDAGTEPARADAQLKLGLAPNEGIVKEPVEGCSLRWRNPELFLFKQSKREMGVSYKDACGKMRKSSENSSMLHLPYFWKAWAFGMLQVWYFHISKGKRSALWSFHMKPGKKPVGKHSQREWGQIIWCPKTKDGIRGDLEAENIKEYLDSIQNLNWDLRFCPFPDNHVKGSTVTSITGICAAVCGRRANTVWFFFKREMNRTLRASLRYNSYQQVFRRKQRRKESLKIKKG